MNRGAKDPMYRMPSYSNIVRFQLFHASADNGCVEEPKPRRYIIIISLYSPQRYCRKPVSGVHPCGSIGVSSESQFQSTRLKISRANSLISECMKCSLQVRTPQSRMAVSTEEASESQILSPVFILPQW